MTKYKIISRSSKPQEMHVKRNGQWLLARLNYRESTLTEEMSDELMLFEKENLIRVKAVDENSAEAQRVTDPQKVYVGFDRAKRAAKMARDSIHKPKVNMDGMYMAHLKTRIEDTKPGATGSTGIRVPSQPNEYYVDHRKVIQVQREKARQERLAYAEAQKQAEEQAIKDGEIPLTGFEDIGKHISDAIAEKQPEEFD